MAAEYFISRLKGSIVAYDEALAERIRKLLKRRKNITERKMFGGVAFLLNGNTCCGVNEKNLVIRLGEEGTLAALKESPTRPMDFTGKPMKTMVYVAPRGYRADEDLRAWVNKAVAYTKSVPPK